MKKKTIKKIIKKVLEKNLYTIMADNCESKNDMLVFDEVTGEEYLISIDEIC